MCLPRTLPDKMKHLTSLFFAALLVSGCSTPQVGIPSSHTGPVATLKGHMAGPVEFFAGKEAHCLIQSVDGSKAGSSYTILPGEHTLIVYLTNMGQEYVGDVKVTIPEPKPYRLKAKRTGDSFALSLIDTKADKVIATSTAPVNQHMQFYTFVFLP